MMVYMAPMRSASARPGGASLGKSPRLVGKRSAASSSSSSCRSATARWTVKTDKLGDCGGAVAKNGAVKR